MAPRRKPRVLVLYIRVESIFVKRDIALLREKYDVRAVLVRPLTYLLLPFLVARCDLVFAWFGDLHAAAGVFWARLFGKRSIVVAGGYDVVAMPEIAYGLQLRRWGRRWSRYAFRHANLVVPISQSIAADLAQVVALPPQKVRLVYHGFDGAAFQPRAGLKKERLVVTVGEVNASNLERKGLLAFARASRFAPEAPWLLAGRITEGEAAERLRRAGGENLRLLGWLDERELVDLLSRAKVYVQPSGHEGFGLSLAEAMLCQCVPVVSRAGAIPEVVGETGRYVRRDAPEEIAAAVRSALEASDGTDARRRILTLYPLSKRRERLHAAVGEVLAR